MDLVRPSWSFSFVVFMILVCAVFDVRELALELFLELALDARKGAWFVLWYCALDWPVNEPDRDESPLFVGLAELDMDIALEAGWYFWLLMELQRAVFMVIDIVRPAASCGLKLLLLNDIERWLCRSGWGRIVLCRPFELILCMYRWLVALLAAMNAELGSPWL